MLGSHVKSSHLKSGELASQHQVLDRCCADTLPGPALLHLGGAAADAKIYKSEHSSRRLTSALGGGVLSAPLPELRGLLSGRVLSARAPLEEEQSALSAGPAPSAHRAPHRRGNRQGKGGWGRTLRGFRCL